MANLVYQSAFIGDALLATPLIKGIQKAFPGEELHFVCRPAVASLFQELKIAHKVYPLDKNKADAWDDLRKALGKTRFKRIFCPHESFRSAWFLRSVPGDVKISFEQWWNGFFFTHRVKRPMQYPDALRQLSLLSALETSVTPLLNTILDQQGLKNTDEQRTVNFTTAAPIPEWASMHVNIPPEIGVRYHERFSDLYGATLVAPGSVWATKRWTGEGFIQLCKKLVSDGRQVVLVGSADEAAICTEIQKEVSQVQNLAGKTTLLDLLVLLSRSHALVCNDSGTMHLAAMAGTPTVSIFGPTTLALGYRPWNNRAVVVQTPLECRPCGLHGHQACPLGTHACMKNIQAEEVIQSLRALSL